MSRTDTNDPTQPNLLFEVIGQAAWGLKNLAEIAELEANRGDLAGVNYALRRISATTRYAVQAAIELRELAEQRRVEPARAGKTFTIQEHA